MSMINKENKKRTDDDDALLVIFPKQVNLKIQ